MLPRPSTQKVQLALITCATRNPKFWPKNPVMKPLHHLVLAVADRREVQIGRSGEQVPIGVDQVADPDQMVVDVAEIVALVELEPRQPRDLVDRAGEQVALRRQDLSHRQQLALEREQSL
jgi:hypothetical protein